MPFIACNCWEIDIKAREDKSECEQSVEGKRETSRGRDGGEDIAVVALIALMRGNSEEV